MALHVCTLLFYEVKRFTKIAGVDLMRIDGSFPSFSDDDEYILYNEGFTGVSAVARDGSHKHQIFEVCPSLPPAAQVWQENCFCGGRRALCKDGGCSISC